MALINAYASYGNFEYAKEVCIISSNLCLSFQDQLIPVDFAVKARLSALCYQYKSEPLLLVCNY